MASQSTDGKSCWKRIDQHIHLLFDDLVDEGTLMLDFWHGDDTISHRQESRSVNVNLSNTQGKKRIILCDVVTEMLSW